MNAFNLRVFCMFAIIASTDLSARQSSDYSTNAETNESGGGLASSGSYQNIGSIGGLGGFASSIDFDLASGYPAQIDSLPAPQITIEQPLGDALPDGGGRDFGVAVIGSPVALDFTIRNTGSAPLEIVGTLFDGDHAAEFSAGPPGASTVNPGSSTTLAVTFTPAAAGLRSATLTLGTNAADEEFVMDLSGTGNTMPTFAGYSVSASYQTATGISLGKLLARAADADGDALTVTSAGPASAQGGTVVLGSTILYTPPNGFSGNDSFPVTITDARGASIIGNVTVSIGQNPNVGGNLGLNTPQITGLPGGPPKLRFRAIPGASYLLQRSTDGMVTWQNLATLVADPMGVIEWTDQNPPPGSAFYRFRAP